MSAVSPALASVLVVSISDFARKPVSEQARLKARTEDLVAGALEPLPPRQRIMLDAPHGVAVAVLEGAERALALAERVQAGAGDLALCIAVNHGPIAILDDATGGGLVGDGITTAMVLAEVATPGRLIASRAFYDALLAESPAHAARLAPTGKHTDSQVRTHELYTVARWATALRRLRYAAVGAVAFAGIVGIGFAARTVLHDKPPAPAVLELKVTPRGDVYVDGVLKGQTPPLTRLEISPGPHTIQVMNGRHPPLTVDINPAPAEVTTIAHAFPTVTPEQLARERAARERAAREEAARERAAQQREKQQAARSWDEKLKDDVRKGVREGWRDLRRGIGF